MAWTEVKNITIAFNEPLSSVPQNAPYFIIEREDFQKVLTENGETVVAIALFNGAVRKKGTTEEEHGVVGVAVPPNGFDVFGPNDVRVNVDRVLRDDNHKVFLFCPPWTDKEERTKDDIEPIE